MEKLSVSDLGLSTQEVQASQEVLGMEPVPAKEGGEIIEASDEVAARVTEFLSKAKVI